MSKISTIKTASQLIMLGTLAIIMMAFLLWMLPIARATTITSSPTTDTATKKCHQLSTYDWVFLYWMPYDNNLSSLGTSIIEMISKGVQSDNILVVVSADFRETKPLARHIITKDGICIETLNTANSAKSFCRRPQLGTITICRQKMGDGFFGTWRHFGRNKPR